MGGDELKAYIGAVPDFPRPGVLFRDISPLLANADALRGAVAAMAVFVPPNADAIAGVEARGFVFAAAAAHHLGLPFVPLRKPGKLPGDTVSASYQLEYGEDSLHVSRAALSSGSRVVLMDDLMATGGTINAAAEVLEKIGAEIINTVCLIELSDLDGRGRYGRPVSSVLKY